MEELHLKRNPEFIIFTGPMFSSKTTRLLATIDRFRYQNRNIIAFKPSLDERYSQSKICTHNGGEIDAHAVKSGCDILKVVKSYDDFNVIAVDEAFMIEGVTDALLSLFRLGNTIVVSSLQLSATGNVFEEIRDMMPWATKIEVCPAVCTVTGRDAYYTHRKFTNMEEITVGGSDLYEPRCWFYHSFMNQPELSGE
jgi:thymidine kinase|tara:strand:+ start:3805 stop:4392 length:588 start_codon:yes stop_codon:yes gene_type:complete